MPDPYPDPQTCTDLNLAPPAPGREAESAADGTASVSGHLHPSLHEQIQGEAGGQHQAHQVLVSY